MDPDLKTLRRDLDHGGALSVWHDTALPRVGVAVASFACHTRTCPMVHLAILRQGEGEGMARPAKLDLDTATGELGALHDPDAQMAAPVDRTWLAGLLGASLGERLALRLERQHAQLDRNAWLNHDWSAVGDGELVRFCDAFPAAWDFACPGEGAPSWLLDSYCVRPACTCREVAIEVVDPDGVHRGVAKLELGAKGRVQIRACEPAAADAIARLVASADHRKRLHERFTEMRRVARRRATSADDRRAPERLAEELLGRRSLLGEDDLDRVAVLGEPIVPFLRAALADDRAPRRRERAAKLLGVIGGAAAATALCDAMLAPTTDDEFAADLAELVTDAAVAPHAVEPLLARLPSSGETASLILDALVDLNVTDPRIHMALLDAARREPVTYAGHLAEYADRDAIPDLVVLLDELLARDDERGIATLVDLLEGMDALDPSQQQRVTARRDQRRPALVPRTPRSAPSPATPPPGRNDPCWCGSGTKYKRCHLETDEAARRAPLH
jgi:hypothetical protein